MLYLALQLCAEGHAAMPALAHQNKCRLLRMPERTRNLCVGAYRLPRVHRTVPAKIPQPAARAKKHQRPLVSVADERDTQ